MHSAGNQREIEIVPIGERAADVGADEQAGGRRRRTEQRVLGDDELERGARRSGELLEQLRHQRRHRHAGHDADALAVEPREIVHAARHALAKQRHRADAILDLREVAVVLGVRQRPPARRYSSSDP